MTIKLRIGEPYAQVLREMAREAHVGVVDLGEIAIYNIIALWLKDAGRDAIPDSARTGVDPGVELVVDGGPEVL